VSRFYNGSKQMALANQDGIQIAIVSYPNKHPQHPPLSSQDHSFPKHPECHIQSEKVVKKGRAQSPNSSFWSPCSIHRIEQNQRHQPPRSDKGETGEGKDYVFQAVKTARKSKKVYTTSQVDK
jgi:hypothetical protein